MNTGIIAEYNPFHKGHLYLINKARELGSQNIIAVMSGNFVQRGEPAMANKHIRTKSALLNGADMVIELPVEYATAGADMFALGGCDIIKKSGIIDSIAFGCEDNSQADIYKIINLIKNETPEYKNILSSYLDKGLSYPLARSSAIGDYLNINTDFMNKPNNILALEYLKCLSDTNIKPIAIKRIVSEYNDIKLTGDISSATAIRYELSRGNKNAFNSLPENTVSLYNTDNIPDLDDYTDILHYIIRTESNNIAQYADITEGLENRIISLSRGQKISRFIDDIKTKRYTYSKIKRALLHIVLRIKKTDQNTEGIKYIRVLGVKKEKLYLLSELSKKANVPVITNVKENEKLLKREIMAADIYNIKGNAGEEYRHPLIII